MNYRFPDKQPAGFELTILKWVFLPILALCLLSMCRTVSEERTRCEAICLDRGFADYRYIPEGRYGVGGNSCSCLTEAESLIDNRIPKGVRVF